MAFVSLRSVALRGRVVASRHVVPKGTSNHMLAFKRCLAADTTPTFTYQDVFETSGNCHYVNTLHRDSLSS
jgi:hypothetical protein